MVHQYQNFIVLIQTDGNQGLITTPFGLKMQRKMQKNIQVNLRLAIQLNQPVKFLELIVAIIKEIIQSTIQQKAMIITIYINLILQ